MSSVKILPRNYWTINWWIHLRFPLRWWLRYTGLRQHVAASAYILFGITRNFIGYVKPTGINADRGITMVIPDDSGILFYVLNCNLYPQWLRLLGLIPAALFALVYVRVQSGFQAIFRIGISTVRCTSNHRSFVGNLFIYGWKNKVNWYFGEEGK